MEKEKEKRELRSPDDTESDGVADEAGRIDAAPRCATVAGAVDRAAAAQQTVITSRRSCGVGHAY